MLAENVAACETYFAGKSPRRQRTFCPTARRSPLWASTPTSSCAPSRALLTRIARARASHINAAVDLGNAVSIKHRLPMGATIWTPSRTDWTSVWLRKATFIPFGSTEEEAPDAGEAVYACGHEIRTRRWTWRQSERGKITENTKAIPVPHRLASPT